MTRIEGFWIYWGGEHYVWAEREAAPKHKYRFEVSADWNQIGKNYGSCQLMLLTETRSSTRSALQKRQKKLLRSSCAKNSDIKPPDCNRLPRHWGSRQGLIR